jgi:hypothetical protein
MNYFCHLLIECLFKLHTFELMKKSLLEIILTIHPRA